jgi:Xaa-Pro aminopeptidase
MELTLARPAPIAAVEFTARRARAATLCGEHGLDGLLVWGMGGSTLDGFADVFYLSNHYSVEPKTPDVAGAWTGFGRAAVVLPASGPATLLTGPPNWRADLVAIDRVASDRDLYGLVAATLSASGLGQGRIGMVRDDVIPMALVRRLERELPGATLVPAGELLAGMRMVKSPAEVALMRHASRVGAAVIGEMLDLADVGATDGDLAAAGFAAATRYGATPYDFAMASGPQSANAYWSRLPTFDPFRRYEPGDIVHPDVFGCVDGYFYDLQRSTVAGAPPTAAQELVLDGAVDLVHHVCAALRAGRRARDVFAAGMEWRRENG